MEGVALRLVSPHQPLPCGMERIRGLNAGAQSGQGGCILWEPRSMRPQGRGQRALELPLALGDGGRAGGRGAPLSVLTVPSQSFSYRHSRRWAASSSFRFVFYGAENGS